MANLTSSKAAPISDCLLYKKMPGLRVAMTNAIEHGKRIDKNTDEFIEDVALEVKRSKAPPYLLKILNSKNTQLIYPENEPLPKAIRVFVAKDIVKKKNATYTAFIDVTNCVTTNLTNKRYNVKTNLLLAYLIDAKINMMYYGIPGVFAKSANNVVLQARAFAKLFTHCIDYLGNISVIPENREKAMYLASKYYLNNILGIDSEEKVEGVAAKASNLTPTQKSTFGILTDNKDLGSIAGLVEANKDLFHLKNLTLSVLLEKWMYLYGSPTFLALEFLPSFLCMITDAYMGVFLNNQKTIEKILGKDLVELGKSLIYENTNI